MELIYTIIYFSIALLVGLAFFSLQYLEKINIFYPKHIDWEQDITILTIVVAIVWPISVIIILIVLFIQTWYEKLKQYKEKHTK